MPQIKVPILLRFVWPASARPKPKSVSLRSISIRFPAKDLKFSARFMSSSMASSSSSSSLVSSSFFRSRPEMGQKLDFRFRIQDLWLKCEDQVHYLHLFFTILNSESMNFFHKSFLFVFSTVEVFNSDVTLTPHDGRWCWILNQLSVMSFSQ